ncbi:uncharacterized protein BT62DRAFT_556120 [Guyanagaster necrorhizus]|uniref:Uncharacterized protein n=1 Tax=Guyanagaster necrorhizus TaxID=856835 RepID=A0A9P7VIA1_9AGAR|nr:uncharacterized protein BT62DRAFT_556120 [Guyanagaster necrorhizus MCA 3950]KAG7441055.1 hypothetical protein BT62DRAFT_556120 [Guyanagaster necrorhizus MCA 3950]
MSMRIEGMYRWCMVRYVMNPAPPGHNLLGDFHMILLLPMSSPVSVQEQRTHQNLSLAATTFSRPNVPICNVAVQSRTSDTGASESSMLWGEFIGS